MVIPDEIIKKDYEDASKHFLQMQKKQPIVFQDLSEEYCNMSPVFGFNSAKYENNSVWRYMIPLPVSERENEPIVNKKAIPVVSFIL